VPTFSLQASRRPL